MAGNKENIDQLFKEGLGQTSHEVPPAFLDDLENKLDGMQRKKLGGMFWSVLFVGVLNFILIGFLFFNFTDNTQPNGKQDAQILLSENESEASSNQSEESTTVHSAVEEKVEQSLNTHKNELEEDEDLLENALTDQEQAVAQSQTGTPSNPTGKSNKHTSIQPEKAVVNQTVKVRPDAKRKIKVDSSEIIAFEAKKEASKQDHVKTTNDAETEEVTNPSKPSKPEKTPELLNPEVEQSPNEEVTNEDLANEGVEEAQKGAAIETEEVEETEEAKPPLAEATDSVPSKQASEEEHQLETKALKEGFNPLTFDLQVYGGIGSVFYTDKLSSSAQFDGLGSIEDGRKMMFVPNVGVNLNFNFQKMTFGIGAEYMQTGERFSFDQSLLSFYDTTYVYTDTTTEEISYYQPYGDWMYDTIVEHIDTTVEDAVITDTTFEKRSVTNRYSWVSIPVSIGYRFKVGKFEIIPRVGAQFNIGIAENKGRLPNESLEELVEFGTTRFNVSYLGQIELRRNFTNWHVFVSPYFKSMINPAIKENGFQRKYTNWGINIGVGFKL